MDREEAIKLFRRDIECLSHDKCSDCILEEACDPMKTPPDSEYIAAYGMAIEALSAEPCEDTISRAAVLDYIDKMPSELTSDGRRVVRRRTLEEYISDTLPSVTPKQKMGRWIPVSERLPEDFQRVLVTIVNYNEDRIVRVAEYHHRKGEFQILENHERWEVGEKGLLAWMPLPEPYKGG